MLCHLLSSPGGISLHVPRSILAHALLARTRVRTTQFLVTPHQLLQGSLKLGSRNRGTLVPHSHTETLGNSRESSMSAGVLRVSRIHLSSRQLRYASMPQRVMERILYIANTGPNLLHIRNEIRYNLYHARRNAVPISAYITNDNSPRPVSSQDDTAPGGAEATQLAV